MFNYIKLQWVMAKVTAEWVMNCVPKFINDTQCAEILATPQYPQTSSMQI